MLNTQQCIAYFALLEQVKYPRTAISYNQALIKVATVDLLPSDEINEAAYDLPEVPAYNYIFEYYDYGSTFLTSNSGAMLWFVWIHLALMIFILIARLFKFKMQRLSKYIYWNALLRLYMESIFELTLLATLNVIKADWSSQNFSEQFSNYLSLLVIILAFVGPLGILMFYYRRIEEWNDEDFNNRFGEILVGLRTQQITRGKRWTLLIYPMLFFLRRLLFVAITFFMADFLTG